MKTATVKQIDQEPFVLKLPKEFDLKPAHEISLPAKRKALIYDTTTHVVDYSKKGDGGGNKYKEVPGWRVVVVTGKGRIIGTRGGYRPDYPVFTDPQLLALHIQALVQEYSKTKKTTVEDTDWDE